MALYGQEPKSPKAVELEQLLQQTNLSDKVDEAEQKKLAQKCVEGYESDKTSRANWEKDLDEWMKLAMQVRENKNYPWPGAANVKYPLLSTAAMQFQARAYPTLVPSDRELVKVKVIGNDDQGLKAARAKRLSSFMAYQILEDIPEWEEDMDRALMIMPITGMIFKKTWYDPISRKCNSRLVLPKDLVVNYWATSLEDCERKTQEYWYSKRQIVEQIQSGLWKDIRNKDGKIPDPATHGEKMHNPLFRTQDTANDETTPYLVIEQHTFYDLDDDGYAEPYVITVLHQTGELLRITARWTPDGILINDKGELAKIKPFEYYTKYGFIPNPDGSFYDVGFGLLLGSLNHAVNTLMNQLIDAGTLSTLQSGWISKGLRVKQGDAIFRPGEWKQVNATLDDLKKGIFPMPIREPSNVLFQLLGMLVSSTKELASVAEIFTGKMPGQNTPAYTTKETVEQGMKVFTAIYKRVYRAMTDEFRKIYALDKLYLPIESYQSIIDDPMGADDFNGPPDDIIPAADPQASSSSSKLERAKMILGLVQTRHVNAKEAVHDFLEAAETPDIERLMQEPPPPPPPPEMMKIQAEMQMQQQEHQLKMKEMEMEIQFKKQELEMKLKFEQEKINLERQKLGMKAQEFQMDAQIQQQQATLDQQTGQQDMAMQQQQHSQEMQMQQEQHSQGLEQGSAQHEQKMAQVKETNAVKARSSGVAGPGGNKGGKSVNKGKN